MMRRRSGVSSIRPCRRRGKLPTSPFLASLKRPCTWPACWARKFSGIAFSDKQAQFYDSLAQRYGFGDRAVPFASLGVDLTAVQKAFTDPGWMMDLFRKCLKQLAGSGAEVILPACACVNTIVVNEKITEMEGMLILDINALLLKVTEGMADFYKLTGAGRSRKLLYLKPGSEDLKYILQLYNFK